MAEIINHVYQFKRGTAQRLAEVNPILRQGEPAFEYDTGKLKIGNGFEPYNSLPYVNGSSDIVTIETYNKLPAKGDSTILYRVTDEALLYQWNDGKYEPLAKEGSLDPSIITLIHGGNANG